VTEECEGGEDGGTHAHVQSYLLLVVAQLSPGCPGALLGSPGALLCSPGTLLGPHGALLGLSWGPPMQGACIALYKEAI
jgi:hypothetical protein